MTKPTTKKKTEQLTTEQLFAKGVDIARRTLGQRFSSKAALAICEFMPEEPDAEDLEVFEDDLKNAAVIAFAGFGEAHDGEDVVRVFALLSLDDNEDY